MSHVTRTGDVAIGTASTLAVAGGIRASGVLDRLMGGGAVAIAAEAFFVLFMALAAAKSANKTDPKKEQARNGSDSTNSDSINSDAKDKP
mmetsp:Transcript_13536/g.19688  ORF Transcript_13536/g.19688 Transcript_13536/m.19688 type:complete len:90 (-) Transcript_13536:541-810(-)